MTQLFSNNAVSTLASDVTDVATSMTVGTGDGALFPSPTGGDFFLVTLLKLSGVTESSIEIVKVTQRTGDIFNVVARGQEGTTALTYLTGDRVQARLTAGSMVVKADVAALSPLTAHAGSTSNPHSVTKAQIGLGSADNTSDAGKPVSTATQTALNLKANLAGPTFTGIVAGITKSMVGLGNADNTSDASKPVSTVTQTALDGKAATSHTHAIADVTGLQAAIDGVADSRAPLTGAGTSGTWGINISGASATAATADAVDWSGITGKPAVIGAGASAAAARTAIGAGTGNGDVTLTGTQTLTNKTFTSPVLGTPASGNLSNTTADGTNKVGAQNIPQVSKSAAYTLVLADAGKHILHPSSDTTERTFTIPANSSVAFPLGTVITFINQNAAGVITIPITSDVMRLAGVGTTGSRTLAANGIATALKLTATEWIISGVGLT